MSIDLSKVTALSDQYGAWKQVADASGRVLWSAVKMATLSFPNGTEGYGGSSTYVRTEFSGGTWDGTDYICPVGTQVFFEFQSYSGNSAGLYINDQVEVWLSANSGDYSSEEYVYTVTGNATIDINSTSAFARIYEASYLMSIAVTTPPAKTTYAVGEMFDPTGMVVTATYGDGSTKDVTGYTYPTDPLTLGVLAVDISYTDNDVTQTTSLEIKLDAPVAYAVYSADDTSLTFCYDKDYYDIRTAVNAGNTATHKGKTVTAYGDVFDTGTSNPFWYSYRTSITSVTFDSAFVDARPKSCYSWFNGFTNMSGFSLANLNTSEVQNMSSMFAGCSALTSLDLSGFDTSSVTNMSYMFSNCKGLASLNVSGWNTSSVTTMQRMFYYCSALTSLDLSSFDTSSVTNMSYMFYYCSALVTIYASELWSTAAVTSGSNMFRNCTKLVGAISYNSSKYTHTYANYTSGYLTYKAVST